MYAEIERLREENRLYTLALGDVTEVEGDLFDDPLFVLDDEV